MVLDSIISIINQNFMNVLISITTVFLTIGYSFWEQERKRINNCVKLLGQEINWNRKKYAIYKKMIESENEKWVQTKKLGNISKWIDEISVGEKGSSFILFRFEAFNYYINSDIPSYLGLYFPYKLLEFYASCQKFCFEISDIKNKIKTYQDDKVKPDLIDIELKKMNDAFYEFHNAFSKFTSCFNDLDEIEYAGTSDISWTSWHFKKLGIKETYPDIFFKDIRLRPPRII